jgi:hypothetical protein
VSQPNPPILAWETQRSHTPVEFPLGGPKGGIIRYLTRKHGPYHDGPSSAPKNHAFFNWAGSFQSKDETGQWVAWDFGTMRVRPTDDTIHGYRVNACVIQGSLDGQAWRQVDSLRYRVSFEIAQPAEFRFIALVHRGENPDRRDQVLGLTTMEFFGTLSK